MEIYTNTVIFYLLLLIGIYLYGFGKLYFQISPVVVDYLVDEKVEWNSKINPYKIRIDFLLFVALTFFTYLAQYKLTTNLLIYNFSELPQNFIGLLGVICTLYFIIIKVKSESKYYSAKTTKLKPTTLSPDKIKDKFDLAINQKHLVCEFSQFENLTQLKKPNSKIEWLAENKNKTKNRKLLLTFLNEIFDDQFHKKSDKDIVDFINEYLIINSNPNLLKKEQAFSNDNVSKWRAASQKK